MLYHHLHYLIKPEQESEFHQSCELRSFYNYVVSSRTDGFKDVLLYSQDEKEVDLLKAILEGLDSSFVTACTYDEQELLALYNPQSPIVIEGLTIYPDACPDAKNDIMLHIPAGPAFGDGRHPTTGMLARHLLQIEVTGKTILDLGCGTGVLGLLAHKRGAASVDFTDVDDDSVRFTKEMCDNNGYPDARVWASDLIESIDQAYELVIANIYADLLLELLDDPKLNKVIPKGILLLSGISFKRIDEVKEAALDAGFQIREQNEQAWWHCLVLER